MGSNNFFKGHAMKPVSSSSNMQARAIGANTFAAGRSGSSAGKDIGAAQGIYKAGKLKAGTKDAASNAPGPKKV